MTPEQTAAIQSLSTIGQSMTVAGVLLFAWLMERRRADTERTRNAELEKDFRQTLIQMQQTETTYRTARLQAQAARDEHAI